MEHVNSFMINSLPELLSVFSILLVCSIILSVMILIYISRTQKELKSLKEQLTKHIWLINNEKKQL